MNKLFTLTALALTCGSSQLAVAKDRLEEVVVTSSRVSMPMRQVGTSVSVVTAEEIKQRGFNSLFEVLRSQPAVAASNTGGIGNSTSLRIRGEEGFRTLMLIDGIDVSDVSGTQIGPRVEQQLSSSIQRVEILRGPQGLMYGADAGGIINISTLGPPEDLGGEISAEGGRFGTQQFAGSLGGSNDTLDFTLSASAIETDGFNARTTDTVLQDDDGYENTTLHGRLGWNVSEKLRVQVVLRDTGSKNEFDDCATPVIFAPTDICSDDFEQQAWRAVADYSSGSFTHQLAYNGNETNRKFYAQGDLTFRTDGEADHYGYLGTYSSSDTMRLVYGVDLKKESIKDGTLNPERDQVGYYAEYQGSFNDKVFITAGLRYDDNDDFGTHTSYRTSGAYLFDLSGGDLKLRAAYGTGFRAPSLSELSYNAGPNGFPPASNVTLREETSTGYDIGLSWHADSGLYLEAVYFDQTVSDEIYFDLDEFSGYLQGDGDIDSKGVELIGEISLLEGLTLSGNYTYNKTQDSTGAARIRRPEQLANFGLNWRGLDEKMVLGLNIRISRDAENVERGVRAALDDYEVIDINASYEILQGLTLYGRVENLLDEDYQEVSNYYTSGAAAYAGVRYSF